MGGALLAASPASAAAAYNGACGSGYSVVNSARISGSDPATVFLTYNSSTGYNCGVTIRDNPGKSVFMQVSVFNSSDAAKFGHDSDYYTTYAGPVYADARGACVDWYGVSGSGSIAKRGTNCG
ncbi:spore-associated protein A [Streptomyces pimonensis]|uniref:Spore-associated protein A n=2 Tax=Streptomyces pimonensis TaxID=2860288 RepID=A0ABV4IZJ7_9ACTN